jgi:hypothetical protein
MHTACAPTACGQPCHGNHPPPGRDPQMEHIAEDPSAEEGVGYASASQLLNLDVTAWAASQATQATQADGGQGTQAAGKKLGKKEREATLEALRADGWLDIHSSRPNCYTLGVRPGGSPRGGTSLPAVPGTCCGAARAQGPIVRDCASHEHATVRWQQQRQQQAVAPEAPDQAAACLPRRCARTWSWAACCRGSTCQMPPGQPGSSSFDSVCGLTASSCGCSS